MAKSTTTVTVVSTVTRTSEVTNEENVAWAAGLYVGEGSGGVTGMSLTMCDEDVVRRFHSIVKVGTVWENTQLTKAGKKSWKWKVANYEGSCYVRDLFWPWLCDRRKQQFSDSLEKHTSRVLIRKRSFDNKATCPNCGYESTPSGLVNHRKRCDKEET